MLYTLAFVKPQFACVLIATRLFCVTSRHIRIHQTVATCRTGVVLGPRPPEKCYFYYYNYYFDGLTLYTRPHVFIRIPQQYNILMLPAYDEKITIWKLACFGQLARIRRHHHHHHHQVYWVQSDRLNICFFNVVETINQIAL